jgi:glutamate dehydrogenase (NAD(P)+)
LDCDVLIPAALENQLTRENASRIKARILLEGANGPTTPEAEEIFQGKGILVIPDVYANAGGVTVSYFEWLKNLSHVRFGRMGKRYEEAACRRMLKAVELSTGHRFTEPELGLTTRGANELDTVNSGLEETIEYLDCCMTISTTALHARTHRLRTTARLWVPCALLSEVHLLST